MRARIEAAQARRKSQAVRRIFLVALVAAAFVGVGVWLRQSQTADLGKLEDHIMPQGGQHRLGAQQQQQAQGIKPGGDPLMPGVITTTGDGGADTVAGATAAEQLGVSGDAGSSSSSREVGRGVDGGKPGYTPKLGGLEADGKIYYYTGLVEKPIKHQVIDEPIPAMCHAQKHADYDGVGITWGLTEKAPSAAACCATCRARSGPPDFCNVWVWCGDPSGLCWTPDIWNHTTGACWLKRQEGWDGNTNLAASNLKVNARGAYSTEYRAEHKTAPERVAWIAGTLLPQTA